MGSINKLISELEEILASIEENNPIYSGKLRNSALLALNQDALKHSHKLEPDQRKCPSEGLLQAWDYALVSYPVRIDQHYILNIAATINGEYGYRDSTAYLRGGKEGISVRPRPEKILGLMETIIDRLNYSPHHPVHRAVEFGMFFYFVHPFADGNGRTSRLMQNLYLHKNNIPPPFLHYRKRDEFITLVEKAHHSYKQRDHQDMFENKSKEENDYIAFIIGKIVQNTKRLSKDVAKQKKYILPVKIEGPGRRINWIKLFIKQALNAQGAAHFQVNASVKRQEITVITDKDPSSLVKIVENYRSRHPYLKKYKILI
ncbi:MAG: Fic family protein [Candidatus Woesearchaeota archaeon]